MISCNYQPSLSEIPGVHSGAGAVALVAAAAAIAAGDKPEITLSKAKDNENETIPKPNENSTINSNSNQVKGTCGIPPTQSLFLTPQHDTLGLGSWSRKSPDKHHFRRHSSGSFMG